MQLVWVLLMAPRGSQSKAKAKAKQGVKRQLDADQAAQESSIVPYKKPAKRCDPEEYDEEPDIVLDESEEEEMVEEDEENAGANPEHVPDEDAGDQAPEKKQKKKGAKTVGDNDDYEDGVEDARTTSRAQRLVIKANKAALPEEVRARLEWLQSKDCKIAGKQKETNKIINAYVPRNSRCGGIIRVKELTAAKIFEMKTDEKKGAKQCGMAKPVLIGKIFGGNRELFQEAVDDGSAWQEGDGKWYYEESYRSKEASSAKKIQCTQELEVNSQKDLLGCLSGFLEEVDMNPEWKNYVPLTDGSGSSGGPSMAGSSTDMPAQKLKAEQPADEQDMKILQECFDSVTRITTRIRGVALELIRAGKTTTASELAKRGIEACKNINSPLMEIEKLMVEGALGAIKHGEVMEALAGCTEPHKTLVEYHNELVAIHNQQSGAKGKSAWKTVSA